MNTALLSPAESQAFQSFLTQIDRVDAYDLAPEWGMYSPSLADAVIKTAEGKEELSKATKNLMQLDNSAWGTPISQAPYSSHQHHHAPQAFNFRQAGANASPPTSPHGHEFAYPPSQPFPTSSSSASSPSSASPFPPQTTPTRSTFMIQQQQQFQHTQSRKRPLITPDQSATVTKKRTRQPSTSSTANVNSTSPISPTRKGSISSSSASPPPSASSTRSKSKHSPSGTSSASQITMASSRPALLTPSQKKANHIQSEQKRRANIRKGYEALCDIVPALRDAIAAEEEANNAAAANGKRRRGRMLGEDGEKMDGRAGPRSESVVLHKTIEHVNVLLSQRAALVERLRQARQLLPPNHPALYPPHTTAPLWERLWDGGCGLPAGIDDDQDQHYGQGHGLGDIGDDMMDGCEDDGSDDDDL